MVVGDELFELRRVLVGLNGEYGEMMREASFYIFDGACEDE